jgi:hypothetical protein
MWVLGAQCTPADVCAGGLNLRFGHIRTTVSRIGRTGGITRYVLPRIRQRVRTLYVGPHRHVWVLAYRDQISNSYTTRVASFTAPAPRRHPGAR